MLQSKEGLAELSTADAYECFSLHAQLHQENQEVS